MCLQVLHGGVNLLDKVDELKARSVATKQEMEVGPSGSRVALDSRRHGLAACCCR
jgi:hypothetical protein